EPRALARSTDNDRSVGGFRIVLAHQSPPGPHSTSVEVLHIRPEAADPLLWLPRDEKWRLVLVGHTILTGSLADRGDVAERKLQVGPRHADRDHHLAGTSARSPEKVVVVAADRPGQAVGGTEEIDRPGFAVVVGEDARLGAVFGRKAIIDSRDLSD